MSLPYKIPNFDQLKTELIDNYNLQLENLKIQDDMERLRDKEQAIFVLNRVQEISESLDKFFKDHLHLLSVFEDQFGNFINFLIPETVLKTCLINEHFFEDSMNFPISYSGDFDEDMISKYPQAIIDWTESALEFHEQTQLRLKEDFSIQLNPKELSCLCEKCQSDFRTLFRDEIFHDCTGLIDTCSTELMGLENSNEEEFNSTFFALKKKVDKKLNFSKFRLRRASHNKLKSQVLSYQEQKFGFNSEIGKVYIEFLTFRLEDKLVERGLRKDLVEQTQRSRFFEQQGMLLWKSLRFLDKEFDKLIATVLSLKRKDISANILKEYLGQFWLYTEARRMNRKIIYHMGPTNSGKTYHAIQALAAGKSGSYLAPLRLLATELYDTLNDKGVVTTLLTGEEVIEVEGATHFSSTIEMARLREEFDVVVIDEIQMICDSQRGWAWTRALVGMMAPEIHICGDPSAFELVEQITKLCGDELEVKNYNRMTKLEVLPNKIKANELERSDALIVFSRRNALKYKSELERLGYKISIIYGRLSPEVRREQARKFDTGETDIIVSTDAIAMGMNLPIKRVVFSTLSKFINSKEHPISNSEIKQIAGRAGRYQRFPVGKATCLERVEDGLDKIHEALQEKLAQNNKAMVGPDLDIYQKVNKALESSSLPILKFTEFLRLFNTMTFQEPFYCVDLKEMIEVTEMVEKANEQKQSLTSAEIFGFSCAPVNLGLPEHVQYFVYIVNNYVQGMPIYCEEIDDNSDSIDYLETTIKCVELFQWLSRHFDGKHFEYDESVLLKSKGFAVDRLNDLLSKKIVLSCSSCGVKLPSQHQFAICEKCFQVRRGGYRKRKEGDKKFSKKKSSGKRSNNKKSNSFSRSKSSKSFSKNRK